MKLGYVLLALLFAGNVYQFLEEPPAPHPGEVMLVTDREYFPTAKALIESAETSVTIIAFEMKYYESYDDSQTNLLLEALVDAQQRGVNVRIVTDEYLNKHRRDADATIRFLRSRGIDARLDETERTTHAKVLIVDGEYVLIGSTNWTFTSFEKNYEANVLIRSRELAEDLELYFESLRA